MLEFLKKKKDYIDNKTMEDSEKDRKAIFFSYKGIKDIIIKTIISKAAKKDKFLDKDRYFMGAFIITLIMSIFLTIRFIYTLYYLKETVIYDSIFVYIFLAIVPFTMWLLSTTSDYWCYYMRKMDWFYICVYNSFIIILIPIYKNLYRIIIRPLSKVHVSSVMTMDMLCNFIVGLILIGLAVFGLIIYILIYRQFNNQFFLEKVRLFRLGHILDLRKNSDNLYDFTVVNDLETGESITVKENDRFTGTLINGPSGTGKTSLIYNNSIFNDLRKKCENQNRRQEALYDFVKDGKGYIYGETVFDKNGLFDNDLIVANKEYKKEYLKIIEKFPDCGVTVMAPNDGLICDIMKLCDALGVPYNVVDPSPDEKTGMRKKGYIGINPFYIRDNLDIRELVTEVSEKATLLSDVISAVNKKDGGKDDVYFEGINNAVVQNVAAITMVGVPLVHNRSGNFKDFQKFVTDFSSLKVYVDAIEEKYSAHKKKNNNKKKIRASIYKDENENEVFEISDDDLDIINKVNGEDKLIVDSDAVNPFEMSIIYVKNELVNDDKNIMYNQARGIRNLINDVILANPDVVDVFMNDNILDFDRIFRKGEVTLINTAIKKGSSVSKGFGLFFILLMQQAMYRRPMETRSTRHFWYIDELPLYLNPALETMISFARQYKIGFYAAIQSFSQFERYKDTAFLKDVFASCGTQMVFGRVNKVDMEYYSSLAGTKLAEYIRENHSSSSMLEDNSKSNFGIAKEYKYVNALEGSEVRNRDFKEITFFSNDEGYVYGFKRAKGHFLDLSGSKIKKRIILNWDNLINRKDKNIIYENFNVNDNEKNAVICENVSANYSEEATSEKYTIYTVDCDSDIINKCDDKDKYEDDELISSEDIINNKLSSVNLGYYLIKTEKELDSEDSECSNHEVEALISAFKEFL